MNSRRLQLLLVLLALWDLLGGVVPFLSNGVVFEVKQEMDGILAARPFSGALFATALVYLYAARDPQRHRPVLWLAAFEQVVAIISAFYQWGADRIGIEGVVLPVVAAVTLLLAVMALYPRGWEALRREIQEARPDLR